MGKRIGYAAKRKQNGCVVFTRGRTAWFAPVDRSLESATNRAKPSDGITADRLFVLASIHADTCLWADLCVRVVV